MRKVEVEQPFPLRLTGVEALDLISTKIEGDKPWKLIDSFDAGDAVAFESEFSEMRKTGQSWRGRREERYTGQIRDCRELEAKALK